MSDEEQRPPTSLHLWWEEATGPLNAEHYQSMTRAVLRKVLLWVPVVAILLILGQIFLMAKAAHEYQWTAPGGKKAAHKVENARTDLDNLLQDQRPR